MSTPEPLPPAATSKLIRPTRRAVITMAVVAVAGVLLILWSWRLWPFTSGMVVTEDSYVRGQLTVLAPQVAGYVKEVAVHDYQPVHAGDVLARIDDRIYREQVRQAEAQLEAARAELANAAQRLAQNHAELQARRAELGAAEAQRDRAVADEARVSELASRGSASLRERDQTRAGARAAEADVLRARAGIRIAEEAGTSTRVSRGGLEARARIAEAQLGLARINLENTVIRAPRDGQLGEASVRQGQYVSAGSQLMFLVPSTLWVVANFKETQLQRIRPGQRARLSVDALGGSELLGRIEGFAPATGSEFSVLRPDNASGNFTKVVQRLPVRIAIDPDQPQAALLRPGMSVVTRVDTAQRMPQEPPATRGPPVATAP